MIITHPYRSGVSEGCAVGVTTITASGPMTWPCGKAASEHATALDTGSMHEPKPYTGKLDWENADTTIEDSVG